MARRRIMAIGVLGLTAVAVGTVALATLDRGHSAGAGRARPDRRDPAFLAAPGWHADHTRGARVPQAPVATAATIPLLDPPGAAPTRTIAALPGTGLIEQAIVYGRVPRSWNHNYPARTLPLELRDGVVQDGWEGDPRPGIARVVLLVRVHGVAVEVAVYFGRRRPGRRARVLAQRELRRLRLPSA